MGVRRAPRPHRNQGTCVTKRTTCLDCKRICSPAPGTGRCATCAKANEDARAKARGPRPWYGRQWAKVSHAAIDEHVRRYGWVCPRCKRKTRDLTTDHVQPRSLTRGVRVLCRTCNSAKGNRT